jgi:hypothetical protein
MARPKKNKLSEQEVVDTTPEVVEVTPEVVDATPEVVEVSEPVTVKEPDPAPPEIIQPEADRVEMDRYFRVINNSEQASRIMQAVSHQRDLQMWGVHQYDKNQSRNSYARSFYFKNRENAVKALAHAEQLLT